MQMTRKKVEPKDVGIQMTSMIDIVFLLNIFFMLVNDMRVLQIESLTLPMAYKATDDTNPPPGRITVNVLPNGDVRIAGESYPRAKLENFLQNEAIRRTTPDGLSNLSLKIRADADVSYKYVQEIMLACMKAKIWKVSFGVSPRDVGTSVGARRE